MRHYQTWMADLIEVEGESDVYLPGSSPANIGILALYTEGYAWTVTDVAGTAGTNPITIHGPIQGGTQVQITTNFGSVTLRKMGVRLL